MIGGASDGVWFVKMVWGVGGWCVVCIRKGVGNGAMVVYERANKRCELRGSIRHDELWDMGRFVPMKKEVY